MDWTETVLLSLVSSVVGSGLLLAVARKWMIGSVQRHLNAAEQRMGFTLEQEQSRSKGRLLSYPMLMEFVYRAKLVTERCLGTGSLPLPSHEVEQFAQIVSQITELLVGNRLLIPKEIWQEVHETKHVCQDLLLCLDTLSRTGPEPGIRELALAGAVKAAGSLAQRVEDLDGVLRKASQKAMESED